MLIIPGQGLVCQYDEGTGTSRDKGKTFWHRVQGHARRDMPLTHGAYLGRVLEGAQVCAARLEKRRTRIKQLNRLSERIPRSLLQGLQSEA